MKGYYFLIIWYAAISIGMSQLLIDGVLSPEHIIGYIVLMGVPTVIYGIMKLTRKPKSQQILK